MRRPRHAALVALVMVALAGFGAAAGLADRPPDFCQRHPGNPNCASSSSTSSSSTTSSTTNTTTTTTPAELVYDRPVSRFGISTGYTILNRSAPMQDFELDQIVRVGAHLVRVDDPVQNADHLKAEAVITKAIAHGLEPEIVLGDTMRYPAPVSASAFGASCGSTASRWHNQVRYFEVINEPNGSWNGPWPVSAYVSYLTACHDAIEAVDGRNVVLLGGIAPASNVAPVDWVTRLYAAGAKPFFAVMNLHLYGDPNEPASWSIWQQTFGPNVNPNVASVMTSNSDAGKPIVSTEGGENSNNVGEQAQANDVARNLQDSRIAQSYIFCMLDDVAPGFGLEARDPAGSVVDPTGTHWRRKPAFAAAQAAMGGTG